MQPNIENYADRNEYRVALADYLLALPQGDVNRLILPSTFSRLVREGEEARQALAAGIVTPNHSYQGAGGVTLRSIASVPGEVFSFRSVGTAEAKKKSGLDKKVLKDRHLNKPERDMYHKPKSDWCESPKGDVCKSACTLDVSDIISKIKK